VPRDLESPFTTLTLKLLTNDIRCARLESMEAHTAKNEDLSPLEELTGTETRSFTKVKASLRCDQAQACSRWEATNEPWPLSKLGMSKKILRQLKKKV